MCAPIALAAISLVAGVAGAVAQYQAAQDQANAQDEQHWANKQNSEAALRVDYSQLGIRQQQEGEKLVADTHKARLEEAQAKARARLNAAESGVTGLSVENLVSDIGSAAAIDNETRKYNHLNTINQLQREKEAAQAKAHGRTLSVPRGVHPSPLGLVAGIGGAAVKAFGGLI